MFIFLNKKVRHGLFFFFLQLNAFIKKLKKIAESLFQFLEDSFNEATLTHSILMNFSVGAVETVPFRRCCNLSQVICCVMYRLSPFKLSRHLRQNDIRTTDQTHSNPCS